MAISTIGTDALASAAVTSAKLASGAPSRSQLPAGTVLQVVSATYGTEVSTTSNAWQSTGLTATITPTSSTSKIYIEVCMQVQVGNQATISPVTVFRGTTTGTNLGHANFGFGYLWNNGVALGGNVALNYLDSPATSSAQQYTVAYRSTDNSTTVYANVSNTKTSITLMEIAA